LKPDLILLAIELPRMNGFSVCNKLKRDPGLKDIPLIIMSTDSSEETFEQHRRLRTRAEDYVHKPVAFAELLGRIQTFVPLASPGMDQVQADDIIVEEDIEVEDAAMDSVEIAEAEIVDPDADVGRLTDRAFASIQSQPPAPEEVSQPPANPSWRPLEESSQPPVTGVSWRPSAEISQPPLSDLSLAGIAIADAEVLAEEPPLENGAGDGLGPNELTEPGMLELEGELTNHVGSAPVPEYEAPAPPSQGRANARPSEVAPPLPSSDVAVLPSNALTTLPSNEMAAPLPSSIFPPRKGSVAPRAYSRPPDAESQRLREEIERHRGRATQLEDEVREARARIAELEDAVRRGGAKDHEVQRLQRELDEAKARPTNPAGKGGASAREFLDLREQVNRKDKELIDLRDQLTHRDKELLGLRDNVLGLERERADLLDRSSEMEKANTDLLRTNEAYKNDKEAASKRAEEFKRKAEKLKTDLDAKTAEYVELKQQFDAELANRTVREAELAARAQAELEQAVLATEATERARAAQSEAEALANADAQHAAFLEGVRAQAEEEKAEAVRLRGAELTQEYEMRLVGLDRASQETIAKLRAEHEVMLAESERTAADRLGARESELEAVRLRELDATRRDYEAKIANIEAREAVNVAERNQTISSLERELALRTSQREEARRDAEKRELRIEGLETDLASTREKLEQTSGTLAERERTLLSLRAEFEAKSALAADLAARLDQTAARLAAVELDFSATAGELEQTRAALLRDGEILMRARIKLQGDRGSLERAKDALAAALAQIDEIEGRTFE
jgi:CheY-like chemotaxis protein